MKKQRTVHKAIFWVSALIIGILLLGIVIAQINLQDMRVLLSEASLVFLSLAALFLLFEGVVTAIRLWLFAAKKPSLGAALKANAWYVLFLVILPARLGEVAAVGVLERTLGQKYGAAAMSIIAQRLYDVIILGAVFLIALLGLGDLIDRQVMIWAAGGLMVFSIFVLWRLDLFLTWGALIFLKLLKREGIGRKFIRLMLQARLYMRHILGRRDIFPALLLTALKWVSNLGSIVFLLMALHMGLPFFANVTVAAAYNFLAIIPLQTVGGIGVGEAGLTLLLSGMGVQISFAAGASLVMRFVILLFPFIFWGLVMGGLKLKEKAER